MKVIYKSKKKHISATKKAWSSLRREFKIINIENNLLNNTHYPTEVQKWLNKFNELDVIMKEYFNPH